MATLGTTVVNRSRALAWVLGACALVLYAAALPQSFSFWDTGELQTVAAILGIAHPPACPAFVLLGWLFVHVLPLGEAAWRVNVMCATAVALCSVLLFATARRYGVPPLVAMLCTLGFATAGVTWHDATRAEVQDLALLFRALAFFFALRWFDFGARRDLFFAALATGLAGATHGIAILLVPALALVVFVRREARDLRAFALVGGGVALGLLPYLYLPLRSAWVAAHHLDPTVGIGLPPGLPFWDYDHPATWPNFLRVVTGADFNVHSGFAGFFAFVRYPSYLAALDERVAAAYGYAGAILAALGAGVLVLSRRPDRIALVIAALLPVPYTEAYTELQDPNRYYLLALWCAAIAIGIAFELLADLFMLRVRSVGRWALGAALVASFVSAAPGRLAIFAQRDDRRAAAFVADVKTVVPDNSILLVEWAYATPLAYVAYVDRALGDRIVVAAAPRQYLTYVPRWLRTRPVYLVTFDSALVLRGFDVVPIRSSSYYVYRIVAVESKS